MQTGGSPGTAVASAGQRLFQEALAALNARDFANAARLFKVFLKQQPRHVGALNLVTVALMGMNRFAEAEGFIATALQLDRSSDASFRNYGTILKNLGKLALAIDQFDHALALNPRSRETWNARAVVLNQLGQYERAIADYDKAIAIDPNYHEAVYNKGKSLIELKCYDEAAAAYDRVLALRADFAEGWLGRGNVLARQARFEEASAAYDRALALQPDLAEAWNARGGLLYELKRYEESLAAHDRALALKPQGDSCAFRGNALYALKRFEEAAAAYEEALAAEPQSAFGWLGHANVLARRKRHTEALAAYDKALTLAPAFTEAWVGRGNALSALKRSHDALAAYDEALAGNAKFAHAWNGRAHVLFALNRFDDAAEAYRAAIAIEPDLAQAWNGLANIAVECKHYDEAVAAYENALALDPLEAATWNNLGNALFELNRDGEALQCLDKALALDVALAEAHFNKALVKLALGEYEEGWQLYEWRWKSDRFRSPGRGFTQPLWLGESDLRGKILLVHCEQGLGDAIQFYRYLPLLAGEGRQLLLEAREPLVRLFNDQNGPADVVANGDALPPFDLHCPLMSLPMVFKTTLGTIPANVPYLHAADEKIAKWREVLGEKTKPRIGVVWSGSHSFTVDRRAMPVDELRPIITTAAEWHVLQNEFAEADREFLRTSSAIHNHSERLKDFSETAALIAQLDLVIAIDTAVAHLAGALGKPVWILLPFHPDFRWLRDREDSPWYPTARLFHQTVDGEWRDVVERLAAELAGWQAAFPAPLAHR